jgi:hypothetical protein
MVELYRLSASIACEIVFLHRNLLTPLSNLVVIHLGVVDRIGTVSLGEAERHRLIVFFPNPSTSLPWTLCVGEASSDLHHCNYSSLLFTLCSLDFIGILNF